MESEFFSRFFRQNFEKFGKLEINILLEQELSFQGNLSDQFSRCGKEKNMKKG